MGAATAGCALVTEDAAKGCSLDSNSCSSITIPADSPLAERIASLDGVRAEKLDAECLDSPANSLEDVSSTSPSTPASTGLSTPSNGKHAMIVHRGKRGFLGRSVTNFEGSPLQRKGSKLGDDQGAGSFKPMRRKTADDVGELGGVAPSFQSSGPGRPRKSSKDTSSPCFGPGDDLDEELIRAARAGDLRLASKALEAGASVNCTTHSGQPPVLLASGACGKGALETLSMLIKARADLEMEDEKGWTAMLYACCSDRKESAALLIESKAKVNAQAHDGKSAVMLAAMESQKDFHLVRFLVEQQADMEARDERGWSLLFFACQSAGKTNVKWLLKNRADACHRDDKGVTPLAMVARTGDLGTAKVLLESGADMNVQSLEEGFTPMMEALRQDQKDIVALLISRHASMQPVNKHGMNCVELAESLGAMGLKAKLDQRLRLETGGDFEDIITSTPKNDKKAKDSDDEHLRGDEGSS